MIERITIYHTNDLHSHFTYWPRISQFLQEKKAIDENVLIFDIGDHVDRYHPYTEATLGKGNIQMLNETGYHGVTIGNNEGITFAHEDLNTLYDDAQFDCILANLYYLDESRPKWANPYKIYEMKGVKVGVIGVTINYVNFYEPLQWKVTDPFVELEKWVKKVREEVDILVILSHLGLSDDERIAGMFPEVDIVLGGHTHHVLPEGKRVNDTILACTGKYGQYVGEVSIEFDRENRSVLACNAKLYPTEELDTVSVESDFDKNLYEDGKRLLQQSVAHLPSDLESNWFRESELNEILCAGLTEWCAADCSFINAGILIDGLSAGPVTEYDIHKICPHPINPCTFKVKGKVLKEVLLQTLDDQYTSLELKGFGFRGKVFGKIIYDNIQFVHKRNSVEININGQKIHPEKIYTLATIDMFAFAKFYPQLTRTEKKFYLPEFIRDVLKWKLSKTYPLSCE